MKMTIRRALGRAAFFSALVGPTFVAAEARANGLEYPSNGTEQMARGSAWLARASDPLAVYYNPAALARNGTAVGLTVNLTFEQRCFTRSGPGNQAVVLDAVASQATYRACNDNAKTPFPNPQLAFNWRVNDKLGVGIAVMGPSAYGGIDFGGTAKNAQLSGAAEDRGKLVEGPAGTRYMISKLSNLLIWPQIAVGYEVMPNLRLGASFIWGVALMDFETYAVGSNTTLGNNGLQETAQNDVKARIKARDYFVPGFVASALYSVTPQIDVAAWYHWSDKIEAKGQTTLDAFAYDGRFQPATDTRRTETAKDKTIVTAPQPMQARIGVRFHVPRPRELTAEQRLAEKERGIDPLRDDLFDVELDGEWSHDSQFDAIGVQFQGGASVNTPGVGDVSLPANSSVPHKWKDSFGVRLGGDYNVLADRLAVRAGAWYQSSSLDPAYIYPDFFPTERLGLTVGTTVRVKPVDIQLGYQHIFMKDQDNKGEGAIRGLSGSAQSGNLTPTAINGGRMSGAANVFSVGAVARF